MAINHNYVWPLGLALIDDLLFVVVEGEEYGIKVYDTSGGKFVTEFGRKGRGPAEYLAYSIQRGPGEGLLEISDASNRKNDIYNVDCIRSSQSIQMIRSCIVKTLTKYIFKASALPK